MIPYVPAKYQTAHRKVPLSCIVIHGTAGTGNAQAVARLFERGDRKASANDAVGRQGEIIECVKPEHVAWHAGKLAVSPLWDGRTADLINHMGHGIECCNAGPLSTRSQDPKAIAKREAMMRIVLRRDPTAAVVLPKHQVDPYKPWPLPYVWERFPDAQIDTVNLRIAQLCQRFPSITIVTAHEDIRKDKLDPGPAFPWHKLQLPPGVRRARRDWSTGLWHIEGETAKEVA